MFQGSGQSPYREMMARQLMSQGISGGPVDNPYSAAARLLGAYAGKKMYGDIQSDKEAKMQAITEALTGKTEQVPFSEATPGPVPFQEAAAPDRQKALALMLGSGDPMMQKIGMSGLLEKPKQVDQWEQIPGVRGSVLQRNKRTGELKQVVSPATQAGREPGFAEKESIKGKQKRLNALEEAASSRKASLKKANKFLKLFEQGEMQSGAGRKAMGYIPGAWTRQGQLDEEFNAFAETAARQALKASGEIRPTDADVKGMKEAMFGVGRDEEVNIQLLKDYIEQQQREENEFRRLKGQKPSQSKTVPESQDYEVDSRIAALVEKYG